MAAREAAAARAEERAAAAEAAAAAAAERCAAAEEAAAASRVDAERVAAAEAALQAARERAAAAEARAATASQAARDETERVAAAEALAAAAEARAGVAEEAVAQLQQLQVALQARFGGAVGGWEAALLELDSARCVVSAVLVRCGSIVTWSSGALLGLWVGALVPPLCRSPFREPSILFCFSDFVFVAGNKRKQVHEIRTLETRSPCVHDGSHAGS